MARKATRQDVARLAGVSGATVSRVYNHPLQVEPATRQAVLESARSLGFIPDRNAAALRRQRSGVILILEIPGQHEYDWPGQREYHAIFGDIVRALMHRLSHEDSGPVRHHLQLSSVSDLSELAGLEDRIAFDGILGFGVDSPEAARALAGLGKPLVVCHHTQDFQDHDRVFTDNRAGGGLIAARLRRAGGLNPVFVGDFLEGVGSHRQRLEGFRTAWGDPVQVLPGHLGVSQGREAGLLLAGEIKAGRVDCVAAVNDLTALGIYQGLRNSGISVPRDCMVCGYDNLPLFREICPLPTVEARLSEVYVRALEILESLMDSRTDTGEPGRVPVCQGIEPVLVESSNPGAGSGT